MTWAKVEMPNLYWMSSTVTALKYYYTPCLVAWGTSCNVTSILIFRSKCFKQSSCAPYLIAIAAVDTTLLFTLLLTWFHIYGFDIYNKGGGCQAVTMATYVCNFLSVWCTVCAIIDRTISVFHSRRSSLRCTVTKANVIIICFAAVSLVVYLNISLLYGIITIGPDITICIPIRSAFETIRKLGQADAVLNLVIPYLLILTLNIRCYKKLFMIRRQRTTVICAVDLQNSRTAELVRTPQEEIYMSYTVIISSSFFILFNLPGHVLRLYTSMSSEKYTGDWVNKTLLFLWQQVLFYLFMTRAASNIFCYLCNPFFRKQLKSLFSKLLICSSLENYRTSLEYSIYSLPLYTTNHRGYIRNNTTRL